MVALTPVCNRCGRCCFYQKDGTWKKCKYLMIHSTNPPISSCRIYNAPDRVGKEIDAGIFCNRIEQIPATFYGCPYNREKPVRLIPVPPFLDGVPRSFPRNG